MAILKLQALRDQDSLVNLIDPGLRLHLADPSYDFALLERHILSVVIRGIRGFLP